MDIWWCPDPECGTAVKREVHRSGPPPPAGNRPIEGFDDEWQPERRSPVRRIVLVAGAIVVILAVLAMTLSPLLWPRRPSLSISPQSMQFDDESGAVALPQAFAIRNDGRGELTWIASGDRSWLHVQPSSGVLSDGIDVVTVSVDARGLPAGSHAATCTVTAEGAYNSPQMLNVLVTLSLPPEGRELKEVLGQSAEVFYGEQPPYVEGSSARPIELANNVAAQDVSWEELVAFLLDDDSDESPYVEDLRMCASFAESLHNNAEAAGIRSAWVSVEFEEADIGHALNAFMTTDRGIVFIDCTGENVSFVTEAGGEPGECDSDKAAYVQVGREYGLVSIEYAGSSTYEFYEEYDAAWDAYVTALEQYNARVVEYNSLAQSRDPADAREARRMVPGLRSDLLELQLNEEVLGQCRWNPLGIVERVEVYW